MYVIIYSAALQNMKFDRNLKYVKETMHKWYENTTLLNTLIVLMTISAVVYFFLQWNIGLPLLLIFGTLIMIRGVIKITMRMRASKTDSD